MLLKISQNSQENTCRSLFCNKVAGQLPPTLLKETPTQVSYESFEIFKDTFFTELFQEAASGISNLLLYFSNA